LNVSLKSILKMNYIVCKEKNKEKFIKLGFTNFCELNEMILTETIAFDSETTGLFPRESDIFCCQIGNGVGQNYIIVMYDENYEFRDLVPYLNDKILIGHNILFDLGFCYKYGFFPKEVRDTMLASKILYNGDIDNMRHDFGAVMNRELSAYYDKTDQKNIHLVKLSQPSTIEYSFNDVDRLIELHNVLYSKIKRGGFEPTYLLHCRYIRALAYMEQCGMPISSQSWSLKMAEDIENSKKWKNTIEEYIYDNLPKYRDEQIDMFDVRKRILVSLTSPLQMIKVFNDFDIKTKDKDGKDSINESIIRKSKHEFVDMWLNFQEANHRVTTFGEKIYDRIINERIYTNFNPMVDTARLSTRRGEINFLNFPADETTRKAFKANPGNKMIVCDWSGQETVIAADLSGDIAMTKSVIDGDCLHCAFARVLFPEIKDLDDETITKSHKDKRQAAKAPRFAFQYGGSAYTIHENEGIPLDRAYQIENAFKELHEGLYTWGAKEFEKAIKHGFIESADGWKLKLPEFDRYERLEVEIKQISQEQWRMYKEGKQERAKEKADEKYRVVQIQAYQYYMKVRSSVSSFFKLKSSYQRLCLNNPVQARGAHQLKLATAMLFEWIEANNYIWIVKICNTIHDEIVCEAPEEISEEVRVAVQHCMIEGGNHYLTNLKIKADANIGESWGDAK
jgi:DNA polymerase I-like protein with 3'-5' exonuclease and polymerase domains